MITYVLRITLHTVKISSIVGKETVLSFVTIVPFSRNA